MILDRWGRMMAKASSALFGGMAFMGLTLSGIPDIYGEGVSRFTAIGWFTLVLCLIFGGLGWFTEESS